ncbi:unnamed protein product [Meganyctiphanes norvegica]|uniref:Transposase n=1 Tax=Meganyctiphanes norvegica TaxID=48144 RepID=A0AAV2SU54_MEGNR
MKENHPAFLGDVSVRTIQKTFHWHLLYKWRCTWKKPIVTRSQMTNRVTFSKRKIGWSITKWKQELWSDKATFTDTSNRSGKVRHRSSSDQLNLKYICGTIKFPKKINVCGCLEYHDLGRLIELPKKESVNQVSYLDQISTHLDYCFTMC